MADKCVACVRASKDPKTHTDDLHHAELLRVNGRCAQLGFDLESAQSLNEDLKTRLLAALNQMVRDAEACREMYADKPSKCKGAVPWKWNSTTEARALIKEVEG
jgi:hypothetical protein